MCTEATPPPPNALASGDEVRVDTWLWAIRQTKSRSAATSAARSGHVKVNGTTAKASQKIRIGDEVRLRVEGFDRILIVTGLLVKRVGAPQARACYDLAWRAQYQSASAAVDALRKRNAASLTVYAGATPMNTTNQPAPTPFLYGTKDNS